MDSPIKTLDPVHLASLESLELRAKMLVDGYLSGAHRSADRGTTAEFAEYREYTVGDDLRYVDWKIYGRTDKITLKQFEAETDLVCTLLVDVSESMAYQSNQQGLSKWEYAQCLALALAHLVLQGRDRVRLALSDEPGEVLLPASHQPGMWQQIMQVLEQTKCQGKPSIGKAMHELAARLRQRGMVVVISDLFDDLETLFLGLKHLSFQGHEVMVMQLVDPYELDFPFEKTIQFQGLESSGDALVSSRGIRQAYLAEMKIFLQKIQDVSRTHRVNYLLVRTDESPVMALKRMLARHR